MSANIITMESFNHKREANHYKGIVTADVINGLERRGWELVTASERKKRNKTVQKEAYHVAKMRNDSYTLAGDDLNIVLINSNDGSSMFEVRLGVFRTVCSNGLVVGDNLMEPMKIPHKGWLSSQALELVDMYLASSFTVVQNFVNKLENVTMDLDTQWNFAYDAFKLKHQDDKIEPFSLKELLKPVRKEDKGDDAWRVYNRVQEHLIKGDYDITVGDEEMEETGMRIRKARKISSTKSDIDLNTKLSDLILEYV